MFKLKPLSRTLLHNYDLKFNLLQANFCVKKQNTARPLEKSVTHCIFDVDGTLVNTSILFPQILSQLCESFGKHFPGQAKTNLLGEPQRKIMETIIKDLKMTVSVTVMEHRFTEMMKTKLPNAPVQESAVGLVNHLDKNDIPMACVSNQTKSTLEGLFKDKPHLFDKFHHVVCLDDVNNRGKPEPDLYLKAALWFPIKPDPERCLVFESTEMGVRAANAAKMKVILATMGPINEDLLKTSKNTRIMNDLHEFKPELYGLPPYDCNPLPPLPSNLRTIQNELTFTQRFTKT